MSALPPTLESCRDQPSVLGAYNMCLRLEERIQSEIDSGKDMTKDMVYCRILGYLFHHLPAPAVNGNFAQQITEISFDDEKLLELGKHFYEHLIKVCMSLAHTQTPSSHWSQRSINDLIDGITNEAPNDHQTTKAHALIRDGFQCVVTKLYDRSFAWGKSELRKIVEEKGLRTVKTQCAYILPQSIKENVTLGSSEASFLPEMDFFVIDLLDCFGYDSLWEVINDGNRYELQSVMTMDLTVHDDFNTLKIWFVATEVPNTYRLEAVDNYWLIGLPEYVTFSTPDPKMYPLPNPTYLTIHATCAKVAHLSGAREYIEEMLRCMEDTCVLAEDGGSSKLLHEAILSSMHCTTSV
ncbi:hypothetical protein EDC04DRAFT_2573725 [Pisolithus marmoratus]|nr:hypothetical protein EDC04DRAFT_2573725 [Pisolithus marmoratus]